MSHFISYDEEIDKVMQLIHVNCSVLNGMFQLGPFVLD